MQCAWHNEEDTKFYKTPYFDSKWSHGICVRCALELLVDRPNTFKKFLEKHFEEIDLIGIPIVTIIDIDKKGVERRRRCIGYRSLKILLEHQ